MYSTKGRRPWLKDVELRKQLYAYKATILRDNVDAPALIIGGVEDHIHALCLLSRKFAIKNVIEEAKTETTKWLKKQGPQYADFHWQAGYGIFSVSESNAEQLASPRWGYAHGVATATQAVGLDWHRNATLWRKRRRQRDVVLSMIEQADYEMIKIS